MKRSNNNTVLLIIIVTVMAIGVYWIVSNNFNKSSNTSFGQTEQIHQTTSPTPKFKPDECIPTIEKRIENELKNNRIANNSLIVVFHDDVDQQQARSVIQSLNATVGTVYEFAETFYHIKTPSGKFADTYCNLKKQSLVKRIEFNLMREHQLKAQ